MLEFDGFKQLVDEIAALGYDRETAGNFAALIGDTPLLDEQGRIVVRESDGTELVRLKLKFYDDKPTSTMQRAQQIADNYEELFDNLGEIALPEFLFEQRFEDLLLLAIKRGRALTQPEVAAAFPDAA